MLDGLAEDCKKQNNSKRANTDNKNPLQHGIHLQIGADGGFGVSAALRAIAS